MGRLKRVADNVSEMLWFTVDDWSRKYRFGINPHPWELSPGHYDEHDSIMVIGSLRNKTCRKFDRGELCCSAWIPADAFHSLAPAFAAYKFKEMTFTVCNLRYN